MGAHGGLRGPVFTSVVINGVCVFVCVFAVSHASATAVSPLTLTSSTASPVAISALTPP